MSRSHSCFLIFNTVLATLLVIVFATAAAVRWAGPSLSSLLERSVVEEESAVIKVVEEASPSVVSIVVGKISWNPFSGPEKVESGIGTGFIVGQDGLILTNRHVVADANANYTVVLNDKKEYPVKKIFRDAFSDLAILKIDATGLAPVKLGDSDNLKVGQTVVAIGNALGRFSNTVTTGVVSGIGRGVTTSSGFFGVTETLENVIQTDAALNPGNSGGPLLNLSSEVIGINVAVTRGAENIGFAIPINAAKPVLENFRKHGRIVRPFLGVRYIIIGEDLSRLRDLPQGAFIREVVPGSPADEAGLAPSDIIVALDGVPVTEKQPLAELLREKEVGERVALKVNRSGEEITLDATLGEAPTNE